MIGLDFGTTNCCVAREDVAGNVLTVSVAPYNTPPYNSILASTVLSSASGDTQIGLQAQTAFRAMSAAEQEASVYLNSFKPYLDETHLKHKVKITEEGARYYDGLQQIDVVPQQTRTIWSEGDFTRDQLVDAVAHLTGLALRQAREDGGDDDRLVLGIPVHFSSRARKRLITGLYRSGLFETHKQLLSRTTFLLEPLAAAAAGMREAFDAQDHELVLVFDHGGGTLDLSLIEFERPDSLAYPIPRRERAAEGSSLVAGSSIDDAFRSELFEERPIRRILERLNKAEAVDYVRDAKEDLSTTHSTELVLPGGAFEVERELLERAALPILGQIEQQVQRLLRRAGVLVADVDRVLLTGGSSLVPCVQAKVRNIFPRLAEENRVRAYDAADDGDVERAITEVAQGLLHFVSDEDVRRLVLWDVDLYSSESREPLPVARRGDSYDLDDQGRPLLRKTFEVPDHNRDGMAFGLWESQLDRPVFLFGLADVPPQPEPITLEIVLRPYALYPTLRVLDREGRAVTRDWRITGWRSDELVLADLEALEEGQLADFFESDELDFVPGAGFAKFQQAPLTRRLRVGDPIEWTIPVDSYRGGPLERGRGRISSIRRIGDAEPLDAMESVDLTDFEFGVRVGPGETRYLNRQPHGHVRLAIKPSDD